MSDDFEEDPPRFKVGRMEGDQLRYYVNRPLALTRANDAVVRWPDKVISVTTYFYPEHGFVAVIYCKGAFPEAYMEGYDVKDFNLPFVPEQTPKDWAAPKRKVAGGGTSSGPTAPRKEGSQRPTKQGKTFRAWEIFDSMPDATRKERIAAGVAAGLNPNMLGTQHSRWAKEQGSPES